ncbi:MAG: sulfite exporter TauE/SafE family protein [Patescibacteria group bacterium]
MKTVTLHVVGTHCNSCKILIEDLLNEQTGIEHANVNLKQETVSFETSLDGGQHKLAEILTEKVKHNGYSLSVEKKAREEKDNGVIWRALPIGLAFLVIFFLIQKSGVLNFGLGGDMTPITGFIIGLVASVSSCLAVVGGLVLSLSATVSKDDVSDVKPMLLFHAGRIASFAILGGLLGALGGAISISFTVTAILGIIASVVMIALGLNLVGMFEKNIVSLPTGIFNFFRKVEHETLAPFLVGVGTFFLPCGFTQSMQIAALSSGSFISGLSIMLAFAIGTLPALAFLSFGSASFAHSRYAPLFFKSAGVIVIGLGIFSLLAGLAGLGVINPLFNI